MKSENENKMTTQFFKPVARNCCLLHLAHSTQVLAEVLTPLSTNHTWLESTYLRTRRQLRCNSRGSRCTLTCTVEQKTLVTITPQASKPILYHLEIRYSNSSGVARINAAGSVETTKAYGHLLLQNSNIVCGCS